MQYKKESLRTLDKDFELKFKNEFKPLINYVREHKEIFLAIRNNYINLYVDGGSILKLSFNSITKDCTGEIDLKYFTLKNIPNELRDDFNKMQEDRKIKNNKNYFHIYKKKVDDIIFWIKLFDEIIPIVKGFQRNTLGDKRKTNREKVVQQELIREFNNTNSNYYAYDMEYVIEGLNDWVYYASPIEGKIAKQKPKTLGRADIMLISVPNNNKIKIYSMEVKEGTKSFGGVDAAKLSFGSGIVGHLKNNVEIINCARSGETYIPEYRNESHDKKFYIQQNFLKEISYAMKFYDDNDLINNNNFKGKFKENDKKLSLVDEKDSVELVFFLGGYPKHLLNKIGSFENHLGIDGGSARYSVNGLLNNKMKDQINLDFLKYTDLFNFKYIKEIKGFEDVKKAKNYENIGFNLNIEEYPTIEIEQKFTNKN